MLGNSLIFNTLWHRNFNFFLNLSNKSIASKSCLTAFICLLQRLTNVFLKFLQSVELRCFLSKLIVKLWQFLSLNGVNLYLNLSLLALVLSSFESAFKSGFFSSGKTFQSLIQTIKHSVGTKLVAYAILRIGNFVVNLSFQIDVCKITLLSWAINTNKSAKTCAQSLKTSLNIAIFNFWLLYFDFYTLKLVKLELWATLNSCNKLKLKFVFSRFWDFLNIKFWLIHWANLLFFQSLRIKLWNSRIYSFTGNSSEANSLIYNLAWYVSLTETWHVDLLCDLFTSLIHKWLKIFEICGNGELNLSWLKIPDADFHACAPEITFSSFCHMAQPLHNSASYGLSN